jgi:hypothetical protein
MRVYSEDDLKLVIKTIMNALAKQACANRACLKVTGESAAESA